jgi:hypothetical protein
MMMEVGSRLEAKRRCGVRFSSWRALATGLCVTFAPAAAEAQIEAGRSVPKEALLRTLPADSIYTEPRELVHARVGRLSTMNVRAGARDQPAGILEHREVFLTGHRRRSIGGDVFDRGVLALRVDTLFQVLYVAETELGYIDRLETTSLPGARGGTSFFHLRYAQTGSGGVTEDLVFALQASGELVEVPFVDYDLTPLLEEDEYLCCGRFTIFDENAVEQTVFVTRGGRASITHRFRVPYVIEGRFRYDSEAQRYAPDFRLVASTPSEREPVGAWSR